MAVWLYVLGWIFRKKLHLPFRETKNFLSVFFVRHFCYADISTLRPSNRYLLCFCLLTYSALVAHNLICVLCYWRIIGFCVCALFYVDLLTHARSTKGVKGFLVELGKKTPSSPESATVHPNTHCKSFACLDLRTPCTDPGHYCHKIGRNGRKVRRVLTCPSCPNVYGKCETHGWFPLNGIS